MIRFARASHRRTTATSRRIAAALTALVLSTAAAAVEVGQGAPALKVTSPEGRPVSLAEHRGKVVYLDFWASWCGPCRQSFPWMNEMQAKYGPQGLVVLAVNVDQKRDDAMKFLSMTPAQFAIGFDEQGVTPKAYAVKAMPSSVLIGPDGKVQHVHRGFRTEDTAAMERHIRAALGVK